MTVFLVVLAHVASRAYDVRIVSPITVLSLQLGGTPTTQLRLGGRVGNWRSDDTIIFDSSIFTGSNAHKTDIYTIPISGGVAPTFISNNGTGGWTIGGGAANIPDTSNYVGNAWTCPGNEYTLFQASEFGFQSGEAANPGAGIDNNVWIYRASSKKIWRLTSDTVNTHHGVLGPQCSEDAIAVNSDPIPIVFGHALDTPSPICSNGPSGGPSDGLCQWFGDWEVCFADVNRDTNGDPVQVSGSYLSNVICEKPRDIVANPLAPYPGSGVSINAGSQALTASTNQFDPNWVGAALTVPGAGASGADLKTSVYTYTDAQHVTLAAAASTTVSAGTFSVTNKVLYEPHRYVTRLGDFYFTSNRRIATHDAVGCIWNHTTQYFREYTYGAPAGCTGYATTWFDEFLTVNPQNQRAIFMSDRAQTCASGLLTLVPEYSDHYLCTMPDCTNKIRLTYFNTAGYPEYHGDGTSKFDVSVVTAVRGAWSPDGMKYVALDQYGTSGDNDVHAQFNVFTLRYPSAELDGKATLSGKATMK